jgi:DNA modification methylase
MNDIRLGDYRDVLSDSRADLIVTSPPYNIGSKAMAKYKGHRARGEYEPKSFGAVTGYPDDLPEDEYQDSQAKFLLWCADHLATNGTLVYNHKPRRRNNAIIHPAAWFLRPEVTERLTLIEEITWDRGSTHNHDKHQLWARTERLYVFRQAGGRYVLNNTIKRHDTLPQQSDVWRINRSRAVGHCAPFPEELVEAAVLAWSQPGQVVVDPYSGSGTTAVVAGRLGRQFACAEILPEFWELSIARYAKSLLQQSTEWLTIEDVTDR